VLLVGDIDRGGVFASFFGTVGLLDGDADRVKGFVVNKFRGDGDILLPALRLIKDKTGVPVLGVIPYIHDVGLDEEDGLSVTRHMPLAGTGETLRAVVLRLNYISNFTDFEPLRHEPDVELVYSLNRSDIEGADIVIIPGSKNTARDLMFLRQHGLEGAVKRAASRGARVIGICGGYQMLGRKVSDPLGIESPAGEVEGMGLLGVETEIKAEKVVSLSEAEAASPLMGFSGVLRGYEIHMGETTGDTGLFRVRRLSDGSTVMDGSVKGNVWGTSLHGIFEDDAFRAAVLDAVRKKKGIPFPGERFEYLKLKEQNIDRWASVLREALDMHFIRGLL
jgi:adenosylcobyric acid synthase